MSAKTAETRTLGCTNKRIIHRTNTTRASAIQRDADKTRENRLRDDGMRRDVSGRESEENRQNCLI